MKASSSPILFVASSTESLLSQDKSGSVKNWDLEKSGYVMKHEINTGFVGFARAQHDMEKNLLVAPSSSSNISIIDLTTMTELQTLKPPSDEVKQITSLKLVKWSDGDTYLLAGYETGHLVLFDLQELKAVHNIQYDFGIYTQDYDLTSNRGLLGGPGCVKVCVFGIDKAKLELFKKDAENIEYVPNDGQKLAGISTIKVRPDRKMLIVGTCDGIVYIHSWKSLRKLATLRNHRGEISDIAFSNGAIDNFKSPIMAVAGVDGNISLWDIYYK